jgi:hypothetical protein
MAIQVPYGTILSQIPEDKQLTGEEIFFLQPGGATAESWSRLSD